MEPNTPALLGYFMTMLYNPKNVTIEVSPLTTIEEIKAGKQLRQLFGYNIPSDRDKPVLEDPKCCLWLGPYHFWCGIANLVSSLYRDT